jgi:hypothetical protein
MGYSVAPSTSKHEQEANLLDKDATSPTDDNLEYYGRYQKNSRTTSDTFLRWWIAISTTVCLALLLNLAFFRSGVGQTSYKCPEPLKATHFYRDTRRMTLDHSNDYLWKEMLSPVYGVIPEPAFPGDNKTIAAISMYME